MIALARRLDHRQRCRFVLNGRPDLRLFQSGTFGFIYSNITLQHIEPRYQRRYIEELVRVLAPGGVLVFQLPSERIEPPRKQGPVRQAIVAIAPRSLVRAYRRARLGWRSFIEMWGMRREDVVAILRAAGATVVDVRADRFAGDDWTGFRYTATR
jgi:SAM-dependent methyltransferase